MNRSELKEIMRGVSVAVPTPFDDNYKLDLETAEDLTQWWLSVGLGTSRSMIKLCSAWGQGPDLSESEWPSLLDRVVKTAGSDANIMCGLQSKDTIRTIEDAKKAQDLGAKSLQIELPYNHSPNQDQYVKHFTMISDAIDIGIMIYNTFWFGCAPIEPDTMLKLEDAEHVAAVKWNYPDADGYDKMTEFSHIFNVIDNSGQTVRCHKNGGKGTVSAFAPAYAADELKVWDLAESGKYEEAQELKDKISSTLAAVSAETSKTGGGYRLAKGMMNIVGHPSGPPRLPTEPLNESEIEILRTAMKKLGWV